MLGSVRSSLALAGTAVVAAFGFGSPASAALPAECTEVGPTTVRCSYTTFSLSKEFVVPAGVTSIHAKAVGAPGRSNATALGGRGAIVTADLPVSPGSTLTAFPAFKTSPDRGFGACQDGGGASGLRKGDLLADRILVAGGGGGAGCSGLGAPGGPGGDAGSAGGSATPGFGGGGGGAGTQTSGGAGGTSIAPAAPGGSGSFGQGASGAAASGLAGAAGGGGGGGWYGGGGGGAGAFGGGGGGGGSSLVPAGGTLALHDARLDPGTVHPDSAVVEIEYSTVPAPAPGAAVDPQSIDFGTQTVGGTSAPRTVTLSSTGTAPLAVASVSITGANPGDFGTSDDCSGKTLASGESCTVAVTFTPSAPGARAATLSFSDNASDSPQTVALSGNGAQPLADLGISLSASPNPVKSGSTLTYAIAVVNRGPGTATNAAVVDALPSAAQFASIAVPAGWSCTTPPVGNTGKLTCKTSAMASGATASLTLKVTVVSSGKSTVSNTVTVASDAGDSNPADNEATATTSVQGRR